MSDFRMPHQFRERYETTEGGFQRSPADPSDLEDTQEMKAVFDEKPSIGGYRIPDALVNDLKAERIYTTPVRLKPRRSLLWKIMQFIEFCLLIGTLLMLTCFLLSKIDTFLLLACVDMLAALYIRQFRSTLW